MIAGVPYDAEVEYLESTGTQWIDTGYVPTSVSAMSLVCMPKQGGAMGKQGTTGYSARSRFAIGFNNSIIYFGMGGSNIDYAQDISTYGKIITASVDLQQRRVKYDWEGGSLDEIRSFSSYIGTRTAGIFAGQGGSEKFKGRLYCCNYSENGVLVRNFIPVRFTNEQGQREGAMYDRVTKKLFRNQGTDAFVIGPDIAKPVMGLHFYGMRRSAREYVQDGLIAMWDGIENAGWGVHNPNATVWKDLVGGNDITLSSQWSFGVSSVSRQYGYTLDGGARISTASNSFNLSQFSIECACARTRGYSDTVGGIGIRVDRASFAGIYGKTSLRFDLYDSSGSRKLNYNRASSDTTTPHTIGFVYDGAFARCIADGMQYTETLLNMDPVKSIDFGIIYSYAACESSCIRIYSRALTTEEVAHNYLVDRVRFNLPEVSA